MFLYSPSSKWSAKSLVAVTAFASGTLLVHAQGAPAYGPPSANTVLHPPQTTHVVVVPSAAERPPVPYPFTIQRSHSYWQTHGFDLAASATGNFQQVVTEQRPSRTNPTESVGLLVNIREHPVSWFGLELNYGFNSFSQRYQSVATGASLGRILQNQHEATAGYVFHIKSPYVQPFFTLGGGASNFRPKGPNSQIANQWRGTYMYEVGFDFVPKKHPHFGLRIQEHGLFYKAPDFHIASLRSNGYIHQAKPSAGFFFRF